MQTSSQGERSKQGHTSPSTSAGAVSKTRRAKGKARKAATKKESPPKRASPNVFSKLIKPFVKSVFIQNATAPIPMAAPTTPDIPDEDLSSQEEEDDPRFSLSRLSPASLKNKKAQANDPGRIRRPLSPYQVRNHPLLVQCSIDFQ